MAHIPYGYKIENGRAVIVPEEEKRIKEFIELYLSGSSIPKAKEEAGIPLSPATLGQMMKNTLYLGDDYYPAILDHCAFDQVAKERQRRYEAMGSFRPRKVSAPIPVETNFTLNIPHPVDIDDPVERAAYIYSCIIPA